MDTSRRDFLRKGVAGSAALAVSGGLSSTAAANIMESRIIKIPSASHFGAFYAHVRDGKIVDITAQTQE